MVKLSKIVLDVKSYAKLLNSVAQQGMGAGIKRPLSPVQCAEYIQRLIDEEGESLDKIAERLNLGKPKDMSKLYQKRDTTQITTFLNLLKVSEKSRELAGWTTDEYPYIPFSTISLLSTFPPEYQDKIIQSILKTKDKKRRPGKEDVKKIKKWLNENPDLSIDECIQQMLKLKPVTVVTHMVVVEIHERLRKFIDSNADYGQKLLGLLRDNLKGRFHDVEAGNSVIAISMDEEAYGIFHEYQYDRGISYTEFLETFLEDKIG